MCVVLVSENLYVSVGSIAGCGVDYQRLQNRPVCVAAGHNWLGICAVSQLAAVGYFARDLPSYRAILFARHAVVWIYYSSVTFAGSFYGYRILFVDDGPSRRES